MDSLEELNLAQNQLCGAVPSELGSLSNLNRLYLDNNRFSGEFPTALGNLTGLQELSIWENNLTWADHYENGIESDTIGLVAFYDSVMSHNPGWMSQPYTELLEYGPLENWDCVTVQGGRVAELSFATDCAYDTCEELRGEIPPELGLLTGLTKLDLSGQRNLSSELPSTVGNLANLTVLNLRGSGFVGEIPSQLGNLTNLVQLDLSNNAFTKIPPVLGDANGLEKLYLNNNSLIGSIPPELGDLGFLEEINLSQNQLSGSVPAQLGQLSNLKVLCLDNNRLTGELPTELGGLSNLQQFSMWDNNLTGAGSYANGYISDTVALVAIHDSLLSHYSEWRESRGNYWLRYAPLDQWGTPS